MKRILFLLSVVVLFVIGIINAGAIWAKVNEVLYQSPCNTPITYRVGKIDPQFSLTNAQVVTNINEAATIWNRAYGKPIFAYDPNSDFTVNLVYDDRQSMNSEINRINADLEQKDNALKPEIDDYKRRSAALNAQINNLNQEIELWNTKGGAPAEEYERLNKEQKRLKQEAAALNAKAESLSLATKEYNTEIQSLDQKVDTYNSALNFKPEGGLYIFDGTNKKIEIYIFDSQQELIHTIAHELGHALGMDHVQNPNSIMHTRTNIVVNPSNDDLASLAHACKEKNILVTKYMELGLFLRKTIDTHIVKEQY